MHPANHAELIARTRCRQHAHLAFTFVAGETYVRTEIIDDDGVFLAFSAYGRVWRNSFLLTRVLPASLPHPNYASAARWLEQKHGVKAAPLY